MTDAAFHEGVGRHKSATARVRLYAGGQGQIVVNDRPFEQYFGRSLDQYHLTEPLKATATESRFDVSVRVAGGGERGQAGAARLGIARALAKADPELQAVLRKGGFLTRDARVKERKKPGLRRARKAPQYTKR